MHRVCSIEYWAQLKASRAVTILNLKSRNDETEIPGSIGGDSD
jgi:hypothetical protein